MAADMAGRRRTDLGAVCARPCVSSSTCPCRGDRTRPLWPVAFGGAGCHHPSCRGQV